MTFHEFPNRFALVILLIIISACGCSTNRRYKAEELPKLPVVKMTEIVKPTRIAGFALSLREYSPAQLGLQVQADSMASDSAVAIFLKSDPQQSRIDPEKNLLYTTLIDSHKVEIPLDAIIYLEIDRLARGAGRCYIGEYLSEMRSAANKPVKEILDNNNPYWQRLELKVGNTVYDPAFEELSVISDEGKVIKLNTPEIEYVKIKERSKLKTFRFLIAVAGFALASYDIYDLLD
jgi:hypothetical protein